MLSQAEIDAYRRQLLSLTASASDDFAIFWDRLDLDDPEESRNRLLAFVPSHIARYGDLAAVLGADFYDEMRASSSVRGRYTATMAPTMQAAYIAERVRFGVQHLWTDDPEQSLTFLDGAANGYILQANRDTIRLSAQRDPSRPRWARVPEANACEFCVMLGSRGYVYASEETAGGMDEFHDRCNCTAVPSWGDDVPGYDPEALYEQYQENQRDK